MITYRKDTYQVLFTYEFLCMMTEHYKEVGGFKDSKKIELSVDWDLYRTLGRQNKMAMFTTRKNKKLIGYNFYIIGHHPHYKKALIAEADSVYVIPEFRNSWIGYKLIKYSVEYLRDKVDAITLNMHVDHKFEGIAKRLGFKPLECKHILET